MNTFKPYIALAIANALVLILVIQWGPSVRQLVVGSQQTTTQSVDIRISPTDIPTTPVPTKIPKRRIVRIPRPKTETTSAVASSTTISNSAPSNSSAPVPTSAPQPQDNRCLIKIDGAIYDITSFRSAHSGGNVFTCGADMSQVFWSKHGKSMLDYMARFRV